MFGPTNVMIPCPTGQLKLFVANHTNEYAECGTKFGHVGWNHDHTDNIKKSSSNLLKNVLIVAAYLPQL